MNVSPPPIPASLAALVMVGGLALIYWSLTGLGLLRTGAVPSADSSPGVNAANGIGSRYLASQAGGGSSKSKVS